MKRKSLDNTDILQSLVDKTLEWNSVSLPQRPKVISEGLITFLKPIICMEAISMEVILSIQNELRIEVIKRTTSIRESIPDEVWEYVFDYVSHDRDITQVLSLKLVSTQWRNVLVNHLSTAFITHQTCCGNSIEFLPLVPNLRSLTLFHSIKIPLNIFRKCFLQLETLVITSSETFIENAGDCKWSQMTNLKHLNLSSCQEPKEPGIMEDLLKELTSLQILRLPSHISYSSEPLKHLVNLQELEISNWGSSELKCPIMDILANLKEMERVTLPGNLASNFNELQKKYPRVKFRFRFSDSGWAGLGYYEGEFSWVNGRNVREGRGIYQQLYGLYYDEAEFKDGVPNGKGVRHIPGKGSFEGIYSNGIWEDLPDLK